VSSVDPARRARAASSAISGVRGAGPPLTPGTRPRSRNTELEADTARVPHDPLRLDGETEQRVELDDATGNVCERCGEPISGHRADTRYCSNRCRQAAYRHRHRQNRADELALALTETRDPIRNPSH
jgi:hypothetical protein